MPDFQVHGYWMVQLEIIIDTIRIHFPKHKPILEQISKDIKDDEGKE